MPAPRNLADVLSRSLLQFSGDYPRYVEDQKRSKREAEDRGFNRYQKRRQLGMSAALNEARIVKLGEPPKQSTARGPQTPSAYATGLLTQGVDPSDPQYQNAYDVQAGLYPQRPTTPRAEKPPEDIVGGLMATLRKQAESYAKEKSAHAARSSKERVQFNPETKQWEIARTPTGETIYDQTSEFAFPAPDTSGGLSAAVNRAATLGLNPDSVGLAAGQALGMQPDRLSEFLPGLLDPVVQSLIKDFGQQDWDEAPEEIKQAAIERRKQEIGNQ